MKMYLRIGDLKELAREYQIKGYLFSKYCEMNKIKSAIRFNAIRNALVELSIVSESKMEKWEEEFKGEYAKCLKNGKVQLK